MDISEFARLGDQSKYQRHPWETSRKNVLLSFLRSADIKFPIKRIVDIGSGDAFVINELVKENIATHYYAIDIAYTPEIIEQLKVNNNYSKVEYFKTLSDFLKNSDAQVPTLFLCMDVLEHLSDESVILNDLQVSNDDNFYFFAVPAFQSVFSSHDDLLGHYRRYTVQQLKDKLQSFDFKTIDSGYYFSSLLLARCIEKKLSKNKKQSIDNWAGGKTKTGLINLALKIDFSITKILKMIGVNVPGLSCYCLCKK